MTEGNEKIIHEILTKVMNINESIDDIYCFMKVNATLVEVHVITKENIMHRPANLMNKDGLKMLSSDLSELLNKIIN